MVGETTEEVTLPRIGKSLIASGEQRATKCRIRFALHNSGMPQKPVSRNVVVSPRPGRVRFSDKPIISEVEPVRWGYRSCRWRSLNSGGMANKFGIPFTICGQEKPQAKRS